MMHLCHFIVYIENFGTIFIVIWSLFFCLPIFFLDDGEESLNEPVEKYINWKILKNVILSVILNCLPLQPMKN